MTAHRDESLRERQAKAVRTELREAFVRLVAKRGLDAVSLAEVADAAGVSERTLYRHYPSREALIQAVLDEDVARFDREIAERTGTFDLADPDVVVRMYEVFEENIDLVKVGRLLRLAGEIDEASQGRTAALRRDLADEVHPEALDQMVGLGRALGGVDVWLRLREPDIGLDNESAGRAIQWALQILLREVRKVEGSLTPISEEEGGRDKDPRTD